MTREIVDLRPAPLNLQCECGSEWWATRGIVIDANTRDVVGYAAHLTCTSCGKSAP